LPYDGASVTLTRPDGTTVALSVPQDGTELTLEIVPDQIGTYGVDVRLHHALADGFVVERADFLAFETLRSTD